MPERTMKSVVSQLFNDMRCDIVVILGSARIAKSDIRGKNYRQAECNIDRVIAKLRRFKKELG